MSSKVTHQTHFTRQVSSLLDRTFGRSTVKDSVLDQAIEFFQECPTVDEELERLANEKDSDKQRKLFEQQLRTEKNERHSYLHAICLEVIELAESDNINECHRKSAQLLGTIALLSPTEGKKVAPTNEINKPLYKAVLCLRLLDRLCMDNKIVDPYISPFLASVTSQRYSEFAHVDPEGYQSFLYQVKVPLVMAAIIQDIGNFHPSAQLILTGESGSLDPFRTLDIEDRKQLLQINYRETIKYLVDGIGASAYAGNSKDERDKFNKSEHAKLVFIKRLLKSSINPKTGSGNLLKVPQIYTSIILSTKANYNYKLLPKVFQVLNQNAERGGCSQVVVDALYQIMGMFPQGFGVTYIPLDSEGDQLESYEYAIVNQLYPDNPEHPACRIATRQLGFISFGQNYVVKKEDNLYFTETAKKLASLSKARLNEILELLASNYEERQKLDLLPRCWHSHEYFSAKDNQKLWNKTS